MTRWCRRLFVLSKSGSKCSYKVLLIARLEGIEGELLKVAISSLVRHTVSLYEMEVKIIGGFPQRNGVVNGGRLF